MHFNKLSIHNFGIYRGRHEIDLATRGKKSIILIGALNGSGKTTFLDALQLVLYGKSAKCSGRNGLSYKDFLKSTINRYASPTEGAGIEVSFDHMHDGVIQTITVNRTWILNGNSVSEKIEVYKQGILDDVLSGQWHEYVEDYIPSSISELFFFDGEKVEALADRDSSSKIIKTGIHSLLGLNIIDKLSQDLKLLQKNKISLELSKDKNTDLSNLESEIHANEEKISLITSNIAYQNTVIDSIQNKLNSLRNDYLLSGGELVENQLNIKDKLNLLYGERDTMLKRLIENASGLAPFMLAKKIIFKLVEAAKAEQVYQHDLMYRERLADYCKELLRYTSNHVVDNVAKKQISEYINNSITGITVDSGSASPSIGISYEKLSRYNAEYFDVHEEAIKNCIISYEKIESEIADMDRLIKSMPDPESIKHIKEELHETESSLAVEVAKKDIFNNDVKGLRSELDRLQRKFLHLQSIYAHELSESESNKRVIQSIDHVQNTLQNYRARVLEKNIHLLSDTIFKCFIKITRKSDSYSRISLSDQDYSLSLFDAQGNLVPTAQLSAGERQVLAVSILWGLTLASGKELPTIIDTPLGRLDGKVRPKLASQYFPYVSQQTIILSTDVEINQAIYPGLKKYIAKEYLIEYSEKLKSSTISSGYFSFEEKSA